MNPLLRPRLNRLAVPIFFEFLLGMLVALLGLWLAARHSDAAAGTLGVMQQVQETVVVVFRVLSIGVGVTVIFRSHPWCESSQQRSLLLMTAGYRTSRLW